MRRLLVFGLCFLISALFITLLPPPAAVADGWEWRQTDWSGGPGQDLWYDSSRYSSSSFIDTMSVPGTIRKSYMANFMTKDAANPVLGSAAGTMDALGLIGYPMRKDGGGYEVLYRGTDGAGINAVGYASSPDGVTWTKHPGNPVLERSSAAATAWDAGGVSYGPILDEGDHYTMFFRGYDSGGAIRYGRATSPDLIDWTRDANFVFGPGAAGSWEQFLDSAVVKLVNGGYGLWYLAFDATGTGRIGYAFSTDGVSWARSAANPVLTENAASWDVTGPGSFKILERPWMDDYLMAYSSDDTIGNYGIGMASSPDGVVWTKDAANPVLASGAAPWYQSGIDVWELTFDGTIYKMGIIGYGPPGVSVGQAYREPGNPWSIFPSPYLVPAPGPAWDDGAVFAVLPFLEGNTLRAFYNGYGSIVPPAIGTATSTPNFSGGTSWLLSSVFDAGSPTQWGNVTWDEVVPAGTSVTVEVRTGDVPVPDGTWSGWAAVANGTPVPFGPTRYIQYKVSLGGIGAVEVSNLAIDLTAIPVNWYFAEGYTGAGFDEWITIQNPMPADAHVWVTYYTPSAVPQTKTHTVPANSRYNVYVNSDLGAGQENSFKVESDVPIICERPMYFRYAGTSGHDWQGGSDAMGSTQLSRQWYFAEGCTLDGFEEYLTIQNPNTAWATVDVTYLVNGGDPIHRQHRVAPESRYTVMVNVDAGTGLEVSAAISSDQPILAERPMYFNFAGEMDGGHIVMGSPFLSRDWYLAEGATFDPFFEYITIQNPNAADATVAIQYYTPAGVPITTNHTIAANSRFTINARTDCGVDAEVSTYLHANLPILVERPMYFNQLHGGLPGGHCAVGVNSTSQEWFFGEGYTGPGFDEYLTVQNPGGAVANLLVTYYVLTDPPSPPITTNHTVDPHSRLTINVGVDAGEGLNLSAYILSDQPVICERPMYFFYQGYHAYNWPGGHDSQGFAP
ncbi:MAG: hypothetical protein AB1384_07855 [Actinomycetota bacterium]